MTPGPANPPGPHRFVSLEGIDGAGKSTLLARLKRALEDAGVHTLFTREETDTFLGDTVRRAVSEGKDPLAILHLFLADRIQHLNELKRPLDEGRLVITDRYHDSTRAYQSIALAHRFDDPETFDQWLATISQDWLILPARTYLLDIDPKTSLGRLDGRSERGGYEKQRFLEEVRKRYLELAEKEPERWIVLDARRPPQELIEEILEDLKHQGFLHKEDATKKTRT